MNRTSIASPIRFAIGIASLAAVSILVATGAWAQGAPKGPAGKPTVAAGDIVSFDGPKMVVRLKDGSTINLTVPEAANVTALKAIPFAELKKGDYIATAAIKQPDGTLRAREVRIFPDEARGRGEGHNPSYPGEGGPNASMTNATVDAVTSMDAKKRSFKVKYKDGEQTIVIPENVPLMRMIPADRTLLKPGAGITVFANENENGLTAVRFGVGLDGLKPPV